MRRVAAAVHEIYLSTAKARGWPVKPECDVPYDDLSGDAKALDVAFAEYHLDALDAERAARQEAVAEVVRHARKLDAERRAHRALELTAKACLKTAEDDRDAARAEAEELRRINESGEGRTPVVGAGGSAECGCYIAFDAGTRPSDMTFEIRRPCDTHSPAREAGEGREG